MSAPSWRLAVPAGVAAAAVGIGVGEVAAAFLGASPLGAVAGVVIDLSPAWLKEWIISVAGSADRVVLIVALLALVLVVSAAAGVLGSRRPPGGSLLLAFLGTVATICAATRPDAGAVGPVPAVLGTGAAVLALRMLVRLLARTVEPVDG